ncbi:MAG: iron-sulfur cluster-binding protein [Bacteroidetes bacterium]|nr:iron-sulfur cluster-binding protein [Bacteroidota bacterium]
MSTQSITFQEDSAKKASDLVHRKKINFNISKYNRTVEKGIQQYEDLELARERTKNIKWSAIENLDKNLISFETNFTKRGGKVIWAKDDKEAIEEIFKIIKEKNAKVVVKAKSMATEEIELNRELEKENIEVFETDLGEFIVQLAGEKPYHIVTPAMHKSKEDVAELFEEKLGAPPNMTPEDMTMLAREKLRQKYLEADIGFSGANFLLADIGGIAITENEGNARLTTTFPKTHIVIVGIEKIISSVKELSHIWPLLATFGTGQELTVYNTILTGPRQEDEDDGPEEMYVILLDNGRTELLAKEEQREALYCIRCGACLNVCPVYKNIGGHAYKTTYSGPIGSVITPHMQGMEEFKHLSFASSLCGSCTEVCPVKINLHEMLLLNRRDAVKSGKAPFSEKLTMFFWRQGMMHRSWINALSYSMKNFGLKLLNKNAWNKNREFPTIPKKSFNQMWRKKGRE